MRSEALLAPDSFPHALAEGPRPEDLRDCRSVLRAGSKSFHLASFLLPRSARNASAALYAMCRLADDAADAPGDARRRLDALARRVRLATTGNAQAFGVDRAFGSVVDRYRIPSAVPEALLEGFAWDLSGRRYRSERELVEYSVRVASTVGVMMTLVFGVRSASSLEGACALGVGMQLTNIARDVGEDARAGRLYLPLDWMDEAGLDPDRFLSHPRPSERLARVVERLLARADHYYQRAEASIEQLPRSVRPAIRFAAWVYAEIGRVIAAQGYDPVSQRAVVPPTRKVWLLARSLWPRPRPPSEEAGFSLPEARFLIEAVPR